MQDWMFETGAEALTWPEPQPQAPEGGPWFPIKSGGDDDWLVPLSNPFPIGDVIVPPPPPPTPGEYYNDGDYGGWDGHDTSQPWVQDPPPPDDDDCRSVHDLRSAGDPPQPGEQEAIDRLRREAIPETTRLLNRIPGGTVFTMPDGASVSIEELRNLWAVSDFEVLDNFNPGNGGPGQSDYNNGNPIFRIDVNNGLIDYMENPNGYTYYPLHELSHVTGAGRAYHGAGHGYEMNESYANALAVAIAAAAGTPMNPHYLATLPTAVQNGVQTTMGTGALGSINPNSPCGG